VVGGVGNGWKVALTTLMNERAGLAFFLGVRTRQLLARLIAELRERGDRIDPAVLDQLADVHARLEVLRLTSLRGLTSTEKYGQPGPEGSLTKWMWSQASQRITQLAVQVLGPEALAAGDTWSHELLRARGHTIEGGTTETLKNIVAERVLGLPKAR
jgi:alkylation response protein AidB-like acyl-CoA dehydrogenase